MKTKNLIWAMVCLFLYVGCSTSQKEPVRRITEQEKQFAISNIQEHKGVRAASIGQKEETLSLAVIVDYGMPKARAKEIGESFVRLVKSSSGEEMPGKEIGRGVYDYLIGVYYPNKDEVVFGAKASIAPRISW